MDVLCTEIKGGYNVSSCTQNGDGIDLSNVSSFMSTFSLIRLCRFVAVIFGMLYAYYRRNPSLTSKAMIFVKKRMFVFFLLEVDPILYHWADIHY